MQTAPARAGASLGWTLLILLMAPSAVLASDPLVTLSTTQLQFGTQAQGTSSSPQFVFLSNSGQADLSITSITLSGQNSGDFLETSTCPIAPAILSAGKSCEIRLIFHPRTTGTDLTATLTISDNASGSPRAVTLTGTPSAAVPGITITPEALNFGNQTVGGNSPVRVATITNTGSTTLNITSGATLGGADASEFKLHRGPDACPDASGQLPPQASCTIAVIFAPLNVGGKSAQIVVRDDAAGSPHAISLSGTAVAP
jgi:HYDIN/CFA65/VesB family protein/centrosomal CEP192-like protein